jgi:hypothetical protein
VKRAKVLRSQSFALFVGAFQLERRSFSFVRGA